MNIDTFLNITKALNHLRPLSDEQIAWQVGCSVEEVARTRQELGGARKNVNILAGEVGCTPTLISKLRHGKANVSSKLALRISRACYNLVSVKELARSTDEPIINKPNGIILVIMNVHLCKQEKDTEPETGPKSEPETESETQHNALI